MNRSRFISLSVLVAIIPAIVFAAPLPTTPIPLTNPIPSQAIGLEIIQTDKHPATITPLYQTGSDPIHLTPQDSSFPLPAAWTSDQSPSCHRKPAGLSCRHILRWDPPAATIDLLPYDTLTIEGTLGHPATVELFDQSGRSTPILILHQGPFRTVLTIRSLTQTLDIRHLQGMTLSGTQPSDLVLHRLTVAKTASTIPQRNTALWLWDYQQALDHPQRVLAACEEARVTRLAVQMPPLTDLETVWPRYFAFLQQLQRHHIEPVLLDGDADLIHDPTWLLDKIRYVQHHVPADLPVTFQVDIEPYTLPGFFENDDGFRLYLDTLLQIRQAMRPPARLSVVVPFWLGQHTVDRRSVLEQVLRMSQDVVVMSYRRDPESLLSISDDILRYGQLFRVPVWLAIETRPLPAEDHLLFYREPRRDLADAYIDFPSQQFHVGLPGAISTHDPLRLHHRVTVRPETLTFHGETRARTLEVVHSLLRRPHYPSFQGIFIHDYQGFLDLP